MYDRWLAFVDQEKISKKEKMLDLACGSGRLALKLKKAGYNVYGLDFSSEMLALASEHAEDAQVEIPLIQGDMRDLSGLPQFAAVTCFADSICYLQDPADVKKTFKNVYQHLQPNGLFLFDVISPYQTDKVYPGYMYNYQDENEAFMWESYKGEYPHSVVHDLTFFVSQDETENSYQRLTEVHHERTYPLEDYQKWLKQAGFKQVEASADFGKKEINSQATRWFFKCVK